MLEPGGHITFPAPGGWVSVTDGYDYTCATRTGGTLWCWGGGQAGPQQVTGCAHPRTQARPASTSATATR